jgi:hypothetical protein
VQDYFPKKWFERKNDDEERYLELASTVKNRTDRVFKTKLLTLAIKSKLPLSTNFRHIH